MKLKKTELGIELEPETPYEKECLKHLANQSSLTVSFTDTWNKSGNIKMETNAIIQLRILCPNCHSQTDNFGGKNKKKNGVVRNLGKAAKLKPL